MQRSRSKGLSRRDWLRLSTAGVLGSSLSGWLPLLAARTAGDPGRRRSCILLWMDGGPSQMDTFDLKPGHRNGGPYKEIETAVPGIRISEHLPKLAKHMDRTVLVRSVTSKEGDHGQANYFLRTGYLPQGDIHYPPLGALLSKELGRPDAALPNYVTIGPDRAVNPRAHGAGFLGPQFAPLVVGDANRLPRVLPGQNLYERALQVENLEAPRDILPAHARSRNALLQDMEKGFLEGHPGTVPEGHITAYDRAVRLMETAGSKVFNLDEEKDALRDAYGRNVFGQGCLLARRLVERGVPFIEITLGGINGGALGWDTHTQNFQTVQNLSGVLDAGWGTLMRDLQERGLLDSTLIVWMGEFGRTPQINGNNGRDHFPGAWSAVLAGGGLKGGQVIGRTAAGGGTIEDRPVKVPDLLATVCLALGVDPTKPNPSNVDRPIRIVDKAAQPIKEIIA